MPKYAVELMVTGYEQVCVEAATFQDAMDKAMGDYDLSQPISNLRHKTVRVAGLDMKEEIDDE